MKRFSLLGLVLGLAAAGCGDNITPGGAIDAAPNDGTSIDTQNIDAAGGPTHAATFSVLEVGALAPMAAGNVIAARGIQVGISFSDLAASVAPVFDSAPGSPLGCKVFVQDTPAELASVIGVNEGVVMVTVDNPAGGPADPLFPTCLYSASAGYICPDFGSSQSPGATTTSITATDNVSIATMTAGSTATMTLTATSAATFGAEDVGRYVKFAGTGNATLDASFNAFPIVGIASSKIAVLGLPLPAATVIPVTQGAFNTLAGVGPQPSLAAPGQLADDATVMATFMGGNGSTIPGGNHFGNFSISWTAANLGDDFTLDDTNANLLRNIPTDGSMFTLTGGAVGTAGGVVVNISTTDTALPAGAGPFTFPPPTTKRVNVRCAALGNNTITVPAAASAYLTPAMSGRTRVQATFVRATLGIPTPTPGATVSVTPIAGHGVVGFTTP